MMTDWSPQDTFDSRKTVVDIAVLKNEVGTLSRRLEELSRVNERQSVKLDLVLEQLSEAKGGLRTMLWFGGAMSGVGAAVVWILQHIPGLGKP